MTFRRAYLELAPELADLPRLTPTRTDYDPFSELRQSALFIDLVRHLSSFEVSYSASEFLLLIDTYASHRHLDADRRRRLHARLTEVIDTDLGGRVTKPYETVLVLGRRSR